MKTLITALAAVATVTAVAAPAVAQPYRGQDRYEQSYRGDGRHEQSQRWTSERVQTAERRIDSGLKSGQLSRREADRLTTQVRDFSRLENRYRAGGVTRWERADLERRWDTVTASMRAELYDHDRQYGYGYGPRR